MASYSEKLGAGLLTGASDPQGDLITVRRVNGAAVGSWPHVLALSIGSVSIAQDGTVSYDDGGNTGPHPGAGLTKPAGGFSFTLWDGVNESPAYMADVTLSGLTGNSAPVGSGKTLNFVVEAV